MNNARCNHLPRLRDDAASIDLVFSLDCSISSNYTRWPENEMMSSPLKLSCLIFISVAQWQWESILLNSGQGIDVKVLQCVDAVNSLILCATLI